jgi:concanavalin A-like lectin/glucanase superfamily protein
MGIFEPWSDVELLLHMDGVDDAAVFTDSGPEEYSVSVVGNVKTEDTQKKFGDTSGYFDGNTSYLDLGTQSGLQLTNNGTWCIDFWMYSAVPSGNAMIVGAYDPDPPYAGYAIAWISTNTTLKFFDGGTWQSITTGLSTNTWYHIAITNDAGTGRFFLDGVQQGSTVTFDANINGNSGFTIGWEDGAGAYFVGYIDEFRIVRGTACWTANFTPPTDAYVSGEIECPPFEAAASMLCTPEIQIPCQPFVGTGALSCGSIFVGGVVEAEPFIATGTLVPPSIELHINCQPFIANASLIVSPEIQIPCVPFEAVAELVAPSVWDGTAWKAWIDANGHRLTRLYYFTLTGDADSTTDAIIPITSWQARRKSGEPTFLSVVIPWTQIYEDQVDARPNGTMKIDMAYLLDGVEQYRETICQADFETSRPDKGGNSKSISLTGHKTESFVAKTIDLQDVIYESNDNGDYRYRCASCDMYLNPGDTARYGSNEITVEQIVLMVGAEGGAIYESMDVEEAAT